MADHYYNLLPCPFCGCDQDSPVESVVHLSGTGESDDPDYTVQCDGCSATMGYSWTEAEAVAVWNRRAAPKADAAAPEGAQVPIPMLLCCPACGTQHVDAPESAEWTNPPHRSHLCHNCGCIWRPADVPTIGVERIETRGKADTWDGAKVKPEGAQGADSEADRIIGRLMSSDPDFDDCAEAAALIARLVAANKGPDGFATWKDAAVAERLHRVALERATPPKPQDAEDGARLDWLNENGCTVRSMADARKNLMIWAPFASYQHKTIREAIDAARAAGGGGE